MIQVLEFAQTPVGPVSIVDQQGSRRLLIGPQVQGGAPLLTAEDGTMTPGAVSESHYQAALLAVGTQVGNQRVLMAGLGAGTGVVALLTNFPGMSITVVEIEPKIAELTRRWFPLVQRFETEGRLKVVIGDFDDPLSWSADGDIFDVAFIDAYRGTNDLAAAGLEAAALLSHDVWLNFIGTPADPRFQRLQQQMRLVGRDPTGYGEACALQVRATAIPRNMLVTSQDLDLRAAKQFVPFLDDDSQLADRARQYYRDFINAWKPLAELTGSKVS